MSRCKECHRLPEEIFEYVTAAADEQCTPDQYVRSEEGTYNHRTGEFYCTVCYVKAGMPLGKA